MSTPFVREQLVEITGRRCAYTIRVVDAIEGGGWGLTLMPVETPFLATFEAVYRHGDGTWRTGDREILTPVGSPIVQGLVACKACGEPIRWVATEAHQMTPVNPDGTSHWGTCLHAERFRKPKEVKETPAPTTPAMEVGDGQLDLL